MSAEITNEERALIDAAIAAGKVQRVPRGVSSERIVWDGRTLVFEGVTGGFAQRHAGAAERIAKRRAKVAELVQAGMTTQQVAERLGCAASVVVTDRQALVGLGIIEARA